MGIQFQELWSWARRRKVFATILVVVTLGIGILIGTVVPGHTLANRPQAPNGAAMLAVPDPISLSGAFASISKNLGPAVVNISTTQVIEKPKASGKGPHGGGGTMAATHSRISSTASSIRRITLRTRNAAWVRA